MSPGVTEGQRTAVTEAGVPQQRKVNPFKLGQAEILSSPGLDVLHPEVEKDVDKGNDDDDEENLPVHNDWSPQYMGQTEHVKLL